MSGAVEIPPQLSKQEIKVNKIIKHSNEKEESNECYCATCLNNREKESNISIMKEWKQKNRSQARFIRECKEHFNDGNTDWYLDGHELHN